MPQFFGAYATAARGGQSDPAARLEVASLLIGAGADVNARERYSGFTPLRCATHYESRNAAMADLLYAHGADPRGPKSHRFAAAESPSRR